MPMDRVPFLCATLLAAAISVHAQAPSGEALYKQRCSGCHDQPGSRIPPRAALQKMPALRILRAMNSGVMMTLAYPLRREERDSGGFVPRHARPGARSQTRSILQRTRHQPETKPGVLVERLESHAR